MKIAIIGTGNVGSALARGLSAKGHELVLGARDPDRAAPLARGTGALVLPPREAAQAADLIILALPWQAAPAALPALGDLSGKIVIDAMNPLAMIGGKLALDRGHSTSGAEAVAALLPRARVVKTLNQVGAEIMAQNARMAARPAMFMAGDDTDAKAVVAGLLSDLGFHPFDAGDLTKARLLEPLAMVWINQAILQNSGRDWALAVVRQDGTA